MKGNLEGDLKGDLEGDLEGDYKGGLQGGLQNGLQTGLGRGLTVMSSTGQLRSRAGLVQVWISFEIKFNSLELDSEVGRLVCLLMQVPSEDVEIKDIS